MIFIYFAQLYFYLSHKNSHEVLIECHASVIFQMVEDKTLINLIIEFFILFNSESFFKQFTSLWYTLYSKWVHLRRRITLDCERAKKGKISRAPGQYAMKASPWYFVSNSGYESVTDLVCAPSAIFNVYHSNMKDILKRLAFLMLF